MKAILFLLVLAPLVAPRAAGQGCACAQETGRTERLVRLDGHPSAFLESYDAPGEEPGRFRLSLLAGDKRVDVLSAIAVDGQKSSGSAAFGQRLRPDAEGNRQLNARYEDVDGDGMADVVLHGTVESGPSDREPQTRVCERVFLWSALEDRFVEQAAGRSDCSHLAQEVE